MAASVLGVQTVPKHDTDKYGIVSLERQVAPRVGKISHIVEKPKPDKAAFYVGGGRQVFIVRVDLR